MKTWEVIKVLTDDPSKKFERVGDKVKFKLSSKIDAGQVIGHYLEGLNTSYESIRLDDDWELVREPVDFMTAVKELKNGKTIESHSPFGKRRYKPFQDVLEDQHGTSVSSHEILEGKWYIE